MEVPLGPQVLYYRASLGPHVLYRVGNSIIQVGTAIISNRRYDVFYTNGWARKKKYFFILLTVH
jgi:hypothetical protein